MAKKSMAGEVRHRLVSQLDDYRAGQRAALLKALALAEEVHERQFRRPSKVSSAQPYVIHPMRVALILLEELEYRDYEVIAAAILHDVIESSDGAVTVADLEQQFGRNIALMVSTLSKPAPDPGVSRGQQLNIYHDRLNQAPIPTRLVKLSDRLDNMREILTSIDADFQEEYLKETMKVYLPMAEAADQYLFEELVNCCQELEQQLKVRSQS
ncbi:MAG TPA: HD domain-containing protein [Candidatus Obscuribacterales bacterium]